METAFVDQAVLKFILGPTSSMGESCELCRKLFSEKLSGSNVSDRSQINIFISSGVNAFSTAILKQCSVCILLIFFETRD
jgi:hypothetical protein